VPAQDDTGATGTTQGSEPETLTSAQSDPDTLG